MDNSCEITTSGSRKESKKNNKNYVVGKVGPTQSWSHKKDP